MTVTNNRGAARRLRNLPRTLAFSMLDHRLELLAKQENAPFTSGDSYSNEEYDFFRSTGIELTTEPARWRDALALAEKEGIREHTGMSRAQLIVGVVRRQIERGEIIFCGRPDEVHAHADVARVIGDVVSTRKDEQLSGIKLLVLQPIDAAGGSVGRTLVAVDAVGIAVDGAKRRMVCKGAARP